MHLHLKVRKLEAKKILWKIKRDLVMACHIRKYFTGLSQKLRNKEKSH